MNRKANAALARFLLVVAAVAAWSGPATAQDPRIALTERDAIAVRQAASFFRDPEDLDAMLRRTGFRPPDTTEWNSMAPRDRLIHVAARAEHGRANGSRIFLHRLASGLVESYGHGRVLNSTELATYLSSNEDSQATLQFPALPPEREPRSLLDARQLSAIEEAVRLLGDRPREAVLRQVFAMSPELARRYLQYSTFEETLRYAITGYEDREMHQRLVLALAQHTVSRYGEAAVRRAGGHLWALYQSCESLLVNSNPAQAPPTLDPPPCGCEGRLRRTLEALGGF